MNIQAMIKPKFKQNTDIEEELYSFLNPQEFLKEMKKIGELKRISNNYGNDVYKLCRNSIAWAIKRLQNSFYLYEIEFVEGTFRGNDHAWMKVGNYYLDLTISQFINAPEFAVCEISEGKKFGYEPDEILNLEEWVGRQS